MFHSDHAYWQVLQEDAARYTAEKERIAVQVISLLDERYPGLAGQVEMQDVATPLTWERYTGNWRGSYDPADLQPADFPSCYAQTFRTVEIDARWYQVPM